MCYPISLIITEDKVFLPPDNIWNHSHSFIMQTHNIPDGLLGDKYLRLEVTPPEEDVFRNKKTNEKLVVDTTWNVKIDETNIPEWYSNDLANQENRAREAAKKWFDSFPNNLVPGYREIAGDYSTLTAGNWSTLTGGNWSRLTSGNISILTGGHYSTLTGVDNSVLTGGNYSTLTGGACSTLTAGNDSTLTGGACSRLTGGNDSTLTGGGCSTLTGGYKSTLTGGNNSTLTAGDGSIFCSGENSSFISQYWDGKKYRTIVFYVGENGILPNKKYKICYDKIYDYKTNEEVKTKKTLKKKTIKNKKKTKK